MSMNLAPRHIALAATLAAFQIGAAHAQAAAPVAAAAASAPTAEGAAAPAADSLNLDKVVVTGTSRGTSKMRSSVAISTLGGDAITDSNAASAAEVLRQIPGIRSESSGGESNANVGVRGIPISAGGARYLQFQEDGLPILQFGDIAFATPDTWLRADQGIDRLEVVRGGSASTLATGAPGGLINFISKTGQEEGGFIALTKGLNFDQTREDFGYGGHINDKTRFFVGGFYRTGDGGRDGAAGTENGGQIRANITHNVGDGFVRLSVKHLDDHTPTFMPTPVRYTADGQIQEIPGLDPRRTAFYNAGWPTDSTLLPNNTRALSNIRDGLSAKSDVLGAEFDLDAGNGYRIQNKFRWSKNSGRFIGIFPGSDVVAAPAGATVATGAGAGQTYGGNALQAAVFNTSVDDASLVADDLRVAKTFALGGGKLTSTAGLYTSMQKLDITWNFNQYWLSAAESGARLLNVPGTKNVNGAPAFDGCCSNFQQSTYKTNAPYALVAWESGPVNLDASLRRDNNSATGAYYQTNDILANAGVAYDLSKVHPIDYAFGRTSYSLGGNLRLSPDLSVFTRYSDGASYMADRITFFNNPGLVNGTASVVPFNEVKQLEGGTKWRSGGLSVFATLFFVTTTETNVDVTTTPIKVTTRTFKSNGLELEAAYRTGSFGLSGGATFTNAKVDASTNPAEVGTTPQRQAKVVYQLSPSYSTGDLNLGATIVGTTKSQDSAPTSQVASGKVTLPAYASVNAFVNYQFSPAMTLALGVNNLFDTIGYTESNDGRAAARAINGRTAKATLKYNF
jgi:outer membrane receptor protein involved in Fe transport